MRPEPVMMSIHDKGVNLAANSKLPCERMIILLAGFGVWYCKVEEMAIWIALNGKVI